MLSAREKPNPVSCSINASLKEDGATVAVAGGGRMDTAAGGCDGCCGCCCPCARCCAAATAAAFGDAVVAEEEEEAGGKGLGECPGGGTEALSAPAGLCAAVATEPCEEGTAWVGRATL